jgi:hypothetical protein
MKGRANAERNVSSLAYEAGKEDALNSQNIEINSELKVTVYKQQIPTSLNSISADRSNQETEIFPGDHDTDSSDKIFSKSFISSKAPSKARVRYQRRNSATASMLISSLMTLEKMPELKVRKGNDALGFLNTPHDEGEVDRSYNVINNHSYLTTEDALIHAKEICGSTHCHVEKDMNESITLKKCFKANLPIPHDQLELDNTFSKPEMQESRKRRRHESLNDLDQNKKI